MTNPERVSASWPLRVKQRVSGWLPIRWRERRALRDHRRRVRDDRERLRAENADRDAWEAHRYAWDDEATMLHATFEDAYSAEAVDLAQWYQVPLPPFPSQLPGDGGDTTSNPYWDQRYIGEPFHLTRGGLEFVRQKVAEEKKRRRDALIHWVQIGTGVVSIMTFALLVYGTCAGKT